MQDGELLGALDLGRRSLRKVREAVEDSSHATAKKELAGYFRSRRCPKWYFSPYARNRTRRRGFDTSRADAALRHRFTVCGIAHKFGKEIGWEYNPTAEPDSRRALNHEWTWQFSRMQYWRDLGSAYWATGDENYAREFARQMADWVRSNPAPDEAANVPFSRWRTIEAGIRMSATWPEAFFRFLTSPSLADDDLLLMVGSFAEHARYLRRFHRHGNWLTMEMNGLYHVGVLFPEFKEAFDWRDFAANRLFEELDAQVYPDGAQCELTPGYHCVALRNFEGLWRLAKLNGLKFPKGYLKKLERMYAYIMYMSTPGRDNPPFNDSWHVDVRKWLKQGAEYFPRRRDFAWFASDGRRGEKPTGVSHAFPHAGYLVMRSSWRRDALYCAFDVGPFGAGHQHEDKLNFELYAYGRRLIADAGSYAYDASPWRTYVLSHRGHNVVAVDGAEQHRRGAAETYLAKEPHDCIWHTSAGFDYAEGSFGELEGEGFGPERKQAAVHRRGILFVKPEFFLLVDILIPSGESAHRYDSVFHLDVPRSSDAVLDRRNRTVTTRQADGPNISILPAARSLVRARIVRGQEKPTVQGWLPRGHGMVGVRPVPTAGFTVEAGGTQRMVCALYPFRRGGRCKVAHVEALVTDGAEGTAVKLDFTDGRVAYFAWSDDPGGAIRFNGREASGRVHYVELARSGEKKRGFELGRHR